MPKDIGPQTLPYNVSKLSCEEREMVSGTRVKGTEAFETGFPRRLAACAPTAHHKHQTTP